MKRNCVTCDGCGLVEYTPSPMQTIPAGWLTMSLQSADASTCKHLCAACCQPTAPAVPRLLLEFKSYALAGGRR